MARSDFQNAVQWFWRWSLALRTATGAADSTAVRAQAEEALDELGVIALHTEHLALYRRTMDLLQAAVDATNPAIGALARAELARLEQLGQAEGA